LSFLLKVVWLLSSMTGLFFQSLADGPFQQFFAFEHFLFPQNKAHTCPFFPSLQPALCLSLPCSSQNRHSCTLACSDFLHFSGRRSPPGFLPFPLPRSFFLPLLSARFFFPEVRPPPPPGTPTWVVLDLVFSFFFISLPFAQPASTRPSGFFSLFRHKDPVKPPPSVLSPVPGPKMFFLSCPPPPSGAGSWNLCWLLLLFGLQ